MRGLHRAEQESRRRMLLRRMSSGQAGTGGGHGEEAGTPPGRVAGRGTGWLHEPTKGGSIVALHPLQSPLDNLVDYLTDARSLYDVTMERTSARTAERRQQGGAGGGAPTVEHRSLNRAVVVAAVGAFEAFCEDLAITAVDLSEEAQVTDKWYQIGGTRGMVQTPNPSNVAKMFWAYFRYDPRPDWNLLVMASWHEVNGVGTLWRGATSSYAGDQAVKALDSMVQVRHGFAHQDRASAPAPVAGMVNLTSKGKVALHSHHAFNAMSSVLQVAIQTTHGLTDALGLDRKFRWSRPMTEAGWEDLLADTPAAAVVTSEWKKNPWLGS